MKASVSRITQRIIERSYATRACYLERIHTAQVQGVRRANLPCGNLAHGIAACQKAEKLALKNMMHNDIAIITAYNDMLSAHQPYENYPNQIKQALKTVGAIGQVAGGVPAMCDGITQGQEGMELSLLSRDVIAMSAAIGLSHNLFDGALFLGVCDKIVPGLLISALSFGHLPALFIPSGPMHSGLTNKAKMHVRQLYAQGKVEREALLAAEEASYPGIGTCTFYGTANSNQMVIETMGLQLPGASFVPPDTALRAALTDAAARQIVRLTANSGDYLPIGKLVNEKTIVNGIVALLATGGSTNLTMHLVAIARAAGIIIDWDDFSELSNEVPLLCRIYPNGAADINQFQVAGGTALVIHELLQQGLLHQDVHTVVGFGLERYSQVPCFEGNQLTWREGAKSSLDKSVIASSASPFASHGGIKVMKGNLGRAVMKTSAISFEHPLIEAPALVFDNQQEVVTAFEAGKLERDCVVVVRFQGPRANGMPELHQLMPPLGVLVDKGFNIVLITDGRLSGASGKVPAAIHITPEAYVGGLLAKVQDGDMIRVNIQSGALELLLDSKELENRQPHQPDLRALPLGSELFSTLRDKFCAAEQGACCIQF